MLFVNALEEKLVTNVLVFYEWRSAYLHYGAKNLDNAVGWSSAKSVTCELRVRLVKINWTNKDVTYGAESFTGRDK